MEAEDSHENEIVVPHFIVWLVASTVIAGTWSNREQQIYPVVSYLIWQVKITVLYMNHL